MLRGSGGIEVLKEHKYKIWDKKQKKFLEINWEGEETRFNVGKAILNYSIENGLYVTLSGYRDEDGWPYEVDADILEYTGLKDKNDKKIYRGYICKDDNEAILEIVWIEDKFQFGAKVLKGGVLSQGLTFPLWHWNNCKENGYRRLERIGNIFKNANLLK